MSANNLAADENPGLPEVGVGWACGLVGNVGSNSWPDFCEDRLVWGEGKAVQEKTAGERLKDRKKCRELKDKLKGWSVWWSELGEGWHKMTNILGFY